MSRLGTVLTTLTLSACVAEAVTLPVAELGTTLQASLAAAELALGSTQAPDPARGPWEDVADLAFLPGGGGVIAEGALRFSWRLNLRNQGLDHDQLESDLQAAAEVLGALELPGCEFMELDVYEVETAFANEPGRFTLAVAPGAGQVLVGVYDPRSAEPGLGAIVLTPLASAAERRALVAHELAHHAHYACHLSGDSEDFAESIEALFHSPQAPERLAVAAPVHSRAPARTAPTPTPVAQVAAASPPRTQAAPVSPAARARAMSRAKANRAHAQRTRARGQR